MDERYSNAFICILLMSDDPIGKLSWFSCSNAFRKDCAQARDGQKEADAMKTVLVPGGGRIARWVIEILGAGNEAGLKHSKVA